jgi:hypothetical protein
MFGRERLENESRGDYWHAGHIFPKDAKVATVFGGLSGMMPTISLRDILFRSWQLKCLNTEGTMGPMVSHSNVGTGDKCVLRARSQSLL